MDRVLLDRSDWWRFLQGCALRDAERARKCRAICCAVRSVNRSALYCSISSSASLLSTTSSARSNRAVPAFACRRHECQRQTVHMTAMRSSAVLSVEMVQNLAEARKP